MRMQHNMYNTNWFDQGWKHIWLPYTQMQTVQKQLKISKAEDIYLITEDGKKMIDGTSSWWTACHGYSHPYIIEKMKEQLDDLSHVMFAGIAHRPAYELTTRLITILPQGLNRVFFTDSGSTAVETASKMAIQYWQNNNNRNKVKFLCFYNGYHGDTMHCMSLSDPSRGYHSKNRNILSEQIYTNIPKNENDLDKFEQILRDNRDKIAGLFIEPLIQGASGFKFHSSRILEQIYKLCKKYEILFIADEIMTGFYKTGEIFACNKANICPDIICIGKSLTAGMMTMAAVACKEFVYEAFLSDSLDSALMSGPTYMANPLACSAALASLDLFAKNNYNKKIQEISKIISTEFNKIKHYDKVIDIRISGAIGIIELDIDFAGILYMRQKIINSNIWIRPFANVVYIIPPFTITENKLKELCSEALNIIDDWHRNFKNN